MMVLGARYAWCWCVYGRCRGSVIIPNETLDPLGRLCWYWRDWLVTLTCCFRHGRSGCCCFVTSNADGFTLWQRTRTGMVLGLALGTPVGTLRWVLGLVLGTPVGTPAWIESTCTTGIVLCWCMFEFLKWIKSAVCTTKKSLFGCFDFEYGCRLTLRFVFSWRRTLWFAFSWWCTLIKSKFGTEGF